MVSTIMSTYNGMARALYDYNAGHPETISLRKGELAVLLDYPCIESEANSANQNVIKPWTLTQNSRGDLGLAPTQYLKKVKIPVSEEIDFVEGCIEAIHIQATSAGGKYSSLQHSSLQKLVNLRNHASKSEDDITNAQISKRQAPAPPVRSSCSYDKISSSNSINNPTNTYKKSISLDVDDLNRKPIVDHRDSEENKTSPKSCDKIPIGQENNIILEQEEPTSVSVPVVNAVNIPEDIGSDIVEIIRRNTSAKHRNCIEAANDVLSYLSSRLNSFSNIFDEIQQSILNSPTASQKLECDDARKMLSIFEELQTLENEGQELNWNIINNEGVIIKHLEDLTKIITEADPEVSKCVLDYNKYSVVLSLVTYYRMDHRNNIREKLLQLFVCFCFVDIKAISILLTSVLPLELSREILASSQDENKLCEIGKMLMVLFSTAEDLPIHHYEYLNSSFIDFVLNLIDAFDDSENFATDILVAVILSFNLHFSNISNNIVIETLSKREAAKSFTEKVILLINREDDPVIIQENDSRVNSVVKLILDMFSTTSCCHLFYTNDIKVLMDIVIRQISDLGASEKMRNVYLTLLRLIILNSSYFEHQHRLADITSVINRILNEEDCQECDSLICSDLKKLFIEKESE